MLMSSESRDVKRENTWEEMTDHDELRSDRVTVPDERATDEKNAGFWLRFLAYLIDIILIGSINGLLLAPLVYVNEGIPVEVGFWTINSLLSILIYYLYFSCLTLKFHQTLGKMIVGLKVIPEKNKSLTWKDIFFREVVGRILHNAFFVLKLLYLVVAFTKEKRGIHDMIGNTKVVHI